MTIPAASADRSERIVRLSILWLQRIAALALFALGVAYWVRLVGVFPGAEWRFDLMPLEWRVAASVLAVLCPVAGVGLWLAASWGMVVWVLVVAMEASMHFALPEAFGAPDLELFLLGFGLALLAVLRFLQWTLRRRARLSRAKS